VSYEDAPTLRPQLRTILTEALASRWTDATIDLEGTVVRADPRTQRRLHALERVALRGRRVLDLGAGIGDLSRAARGAQAELVDAIDVDEELARLGRLLCVLQDVDRVSCFEGDAGLASTYADEYDVILAFGQLEQIRPILPRVAQNLRGVLVTELDDESGDAALSETLPARETLLTGNGDEPAIVACAAELPALRTHLTDSAPAAAHAA
jgi:SAM-dependent methyltransferase